jgi:ribosomal protein L16 Arg81 hydroxylase
VAARRSSVAAFLYGTRLGGAICPADGGIITQFLQQLSDISMSSVTCAVAPAGQILNCLLDPVEPDLFMSSYWEHASLYIHGWPDKLAELFNREEFFSAIAPSRDAPPGRQLVFIKAGNPGPDGNHNEVLIRPEQVAPLLRAGLTIQAERLETAHPVLQALARSLKEEIRIPAQVDIAAFLSSDRGGFGLHYDSPSMWILQIAGAKRWWYSPEPVIAFPLEGRMPTAREREQGVDGLYRDDELTEQLLTAGDVLYLPGGSWHRVRAEGESLHLCITVRPSNYLQLAYDALAQSLLSNTNWRHAPMPRASAGDLDGMDRQLNELFAVRLVELRAAVEKLTPADLYMSWKDRVQDV